MRQLRRLHMNALKLSQVLVEKDDTWKVSYRPKAPFDMTSVPVDKKIHDDDPPKDVVIDDDTPKDVVIDDDPPKDVVTDEISTDVRQNALLLAAENGCIEIVQEILKEHPLAIEQFNKNRQNLLHLVIKNRHMNIFKYVTSTYGEPVKWMSTTFDNDGNSILHMVGCLDKSQSSVDTKVINPVYQLSADLLLLEDLKEKCPPSLSYHHNNQMQTADAMFALNSKKLQEDAKKWLDRTTQQGIVVAGLIVTVVFAAVYQVPGGPNSKGVPNLIDQPFFRVFTSTDVLSLASALTSIVLFLCIHTSSVELDQFRRKLQFKLLISFTFLFISVSTMMVTFAATIILIVQNQTPRTSNILIYLAVCVPVAVLMVSYIPLYIQLATSFIEWVHKILTQLFSSTTNLLVKKNKSELPH